ncbi:MAG: type VI secretion system baseplate subunit TssG [Terriglobia bacterium]
MASPSRTIDTDVKYEAVGRELRDRPYRFEFFQAVRLIERILARRQPVGRFTKPSEEVARFGAHTSFSFPASQIQAIDWEEGQQPKLTVNFMGMTGPLGVLPLYYTELAAVRLRAGDKALRDFLDVFNHRMISLFYRAWEKYRFVATYERGDRDSLTHYLKDLIGLGTAGLGDRQGLLADDALLYYAGLLAQRPRSATALRQILSDYFGVPVEIEQFAGAWYRLEADNQCQFGQEGSPSEQLGGGAVAGDEVWTQESRVRIKLGPLALPRYLDFLPSGTAFEPLRTLTKFFSNDEIDFEVQLILKREEVPACELGAEGEASPRLGWITWVKTASTEHDAGDTVFAL